MACITVSIDKSFKERLEKFPWINWSEIVREELLKKYVFYKYIKTGELTKEEEKFCGQIDWHPVDELPLKEEFIKKLNKIKNSSHSKPIKPERLKEWFEKL